MHVQICCFDVLVAVRVVGSLIPDNSTEASGAFCVRKV